MQWKNNRKKKTKKVSGLLVTRYRTGQKTWQGESHHVLPKILTDEKPDGYEDKHIIVRQIVSKCIENIIKFVRKITMWRKIENNLKFSKNGLGSSKQFLKVPFSASYYPRKMDVSYPVLSPLQRFSNLHGTKKSYDHS